MVRKSKSRDIAKLGKAMARVVCYVLYLYISILVSAVWERGVDEGLYL
jgi:hypothetical protein